MTTQQIEQILEEHIKITIYAFNSFSLNGVKEAAQAIYEAIEKERQDFIFKREPGYDNEFERGSDIIQPEQGTPQP